jgi:hypothetical protein
MAEPRMDTNRLEHLLSDLFSLEVNTIIKQGMTATKMPNLAHALIDVARDYGLALNRMGAEPADLPSDASLATFQALRHRASSHARKLEGLPDDAREAQRARTSTKELTDEEGSKLLLLCRIRDTSDQMQALFLDTKGEPRKDRRGMAVAFDRGAANAFADGDFALLDKHLLALRKAWELGTEEVVMQTVVYLDGDVITRVRADFASAENRPMLEVHQGAVNTSITFWRGLIDVVRSLFGTMVGGGAGAVRGPE